MSTSEINCSSCNIETSIGELFRHGKCVHSSCRKCLINYITENLKVKVKCPIESCSQFIQDSLIRKCLSNDQIMTYDQLSIAGASLKLKKCPMKECPFMYIAEENIGIFDCGYCESPICIKCDSFHYPQDCRMTTIKSEAKEEGHKMSQDHHINSGIICFVAVCVYFWKFGGSNVLYYAIALIIFPILYVIIWAFLSTDLSTISNDEDHQVPDRISLTTNNFYSRSIEKIKEKRRNNFLDLDEHYDLLPNPQAYECTFCTELILPRDGVILRNCLHCFCRTCLKDVYATKNYTHQLKCQICNSKLQDKELEVLIEEKRFVSMMKSEISAIMYNCKKEGCDGVCDVTLGAKSFPCGICSSVNCIDCNDIHKDMTCEEFKNSKNYIDSDKELEILKDLNGIHCCQCKNLLIPKGGCGSLYCNKCGNHICVFTGKFAGKHIQKKCGCLTLVSCYREEKYCECDPKKPCHSKCIYGCIPDD